MAIPQWKNVYNGLPFSKFALSLSYSSPKKLDVIQRTGRKIHSYNNQQLPSGSQHQILRRNLRQLKQHMKNTSEGRKTWEIE